MITGLHDRYQQAKGQKVINSIDAWKAIQEALLTNDPLLAFAAYYHTWLNGNLGFVPMYEVKETKLGMGMTLFAMKPFRVELFLFRGGTIIPDHKHPDVESYEVYVAGDMELTKDGQPQTIRNWVRPDENGVCMSNGGMIRIPAGCTHGGWVNQHITGHHLSGGAFVSIQYWKRNWEDQSVTFNWRGEETHG